MIRIGLAQMDIVWEDIEENKKKVETFLRKAQEEALDWLVFPEMTMTGFSMNTSMASYYEEEKTYFSEKAAEYGIGIVYGVIAPGESGKFENHLLMVDQAGRYLMEYAKIHPFSYGAESQYYSGGEKISACHWKNTILSGFICYDLRFPAIFEIASQESQVIFVIANWPDSRIGHWDALLKARAIEGCCYVVGVNRCGRAGRLNYNGHSAIYDYLGRCLTRCSEQEELIIGEIDESAVEPYRDHFPAIKDRRRELYRRLDLEMF